MSDNVEIRCRICLDVETDHVPILEDAAIQLHMRSCLSITISGNDNLPKTICVTCVSLLSEFYNFQLNARCSQDWLESSIQEKTRKATETKTPIQPLPDSEYNSDSLLEFLNNTENIEEYLSNLGKDDIPSIVNMLDKNQENSMDAVHKLTINLKPVKVPSPKKKEPAIKSKSRPLKMEIDVLDSDIEIVQEILMKETEKPKAIQTKSTEKQSYTCFGCKEKFDGIQKLSQHVIICDIAIRTCSTCSLLFDSKIQMLRHRVTHIASYPTVCNCGKQFATKEKLVQHLKYCSIDYIAAIGNIYRCKQCSSTFMDRLQLYKHCKAHVLKASERKCDICPHSFASDEELAYHKTKEHNKSDGSLYRCKLCKYTSKDRKEIYLHVQKHTITVAPKRHLCESCGQSFSTHPSLMRHSLQQHKTTQEINCSVCNKQFKCVEDKTRHVCEGENFICDHCGQSVKCGKFSSHICSVNITIDIERL